MANFSTIKFHGTFRAYQQRVLDNAGAFLKNGKIHIVAAPGSGKTILGLELIRRLGSPALILSPTIAIREQWKERFSEKFVDSEREADAYFSVSLKDPKPITSITYQGLYSSYRKMAKLTQEEDDSDEPQEDFSSVNILRLLKEQKIGTICLDEAHHLRAEWQKALYEFIKEVEHGVKIIALTATPPYDSKKSEWDKYIEVCGEIDDEIFVPELVRTQTLCPHQDYICYNYPSEAEIGAIKTYKDNVNGAVKQIFADGEFLKMIQSGAFYQDPARWAEKLLDNPAFLKSMLSFLYAGNQTENKKLFALVEKSERRTPFTLAAAEILFTGMMTNEALFSEEHREFVKVFLNRHGLVEKKKVCLVSNSRLDKLLVSSKGKLESIQKIAAFESQSLGEQIRLLVLTDYIKDNTALLGSGKEITEMGVIPVFELLRRSSPQLKTAAVSGRIMIIPNEAADGISTIAKKENAAIRLIPVKNTAHSEIRFEGAKSAQKIAVITKAFNQGIINAIVGTKSLLGEGWDSPVINTLVLASFVGSFVLSNQMRGRAIRVDPQNPGKVSNIWHLTTILPEYLNYENKLEQFFKKAVYQLRGGGGGNEKTTPLSADYDTMLRRFETFVGLHYESDTIGNGLERANFLSPPFDGDAAAANQKTFNLAADRKAVSGRWESALARATDEIVVESEQKRPALHKKFVYRNVLALALLSVVLSALLALVQEIAAALPGAWIFLGIPLALAAAALYFYLVKKLMLLLSPYKTFEAISKAVLNTFRDLSLIGRAAVLEIGQSKKTFEITIGIRNCSNYEKNLFFNAVAVLFNPIENPRYLLIKGGVFLDYKTSFAVPDVFADNQSHAEAFAQNMSRRLMGFGAYYTRSAEGRKLLNRCRRSAFISKNYAQIHGKKKLKQKWE